MVVEQLNANPNNREGLAQFVQQWNPSSTDPAAQKNTLTEADRGHTVTAIVSAVIYTYDNQARASAGVKVR